MRLGRSLLFTSAAYETKTLKITFQRMANCLFWLLFSLICCYLSLFAFLSSLAMFIFQPIFRGYFSRGHGHFNIARQKNVQTCQNNLFYPKKIERLIFKYILERSRVDCRHHTQLIEHHTQPMNKWTTRPSLRIRQATASASTISRPKLQTNPSDRRYPCWQVKNWNMFICHAITALHTLTLSLWIIESHTFGCWSKRNGHIALTACEPR